MVAINPTLVLRCLPCSNSTAGPLLGVYWLLCIAKLTRWQAWRMITAVHERMTTKWPDLHLRACERIATRLLAALAHRDEIHSYAKNQYRMVTAV